MKRPIYLISLLAALLKLSAISAQTGLITTVVGNGMGNGYTSKHASFESPNSVAMDKAGNLYISDGTNEEIRVINAVSGIVSSYTGNGYYAYNQGGFSGDGGPATAAELNAPSSIAFDTAYNLYICDSYNNRIRKVSRATGIITTIAGNGGGGYNGDGIAATAASLYAPVSICLDDSANVYIADQQNDRIRKVSALTGIISTVAGNGYRATLNSGGYSGDGGPATAAELFYPDGVAFDTAMNLYITDNENYRIRRIDANTGIITTICGDGLDFSNGNGGPATGAQIGKSSSISIDKNDSLYFADYEHSIFRVINLSTGIINLFAGLGAPYSQHYNGEGLPADSTTVYNPGALYFVANGDIYIPNSGDNRVQKFDHITGLVHTIAGGLIDSVPATNTELIGCTGFAFDTYGNMYISENWNCSVRKYNPNTGMLTVFAGNGTDSAGVNNKPAIDAPVCGPNGITIDPNNNIYLTTGGTNFGGVVQEINGNTGIITNIAGNGWGGYYGDGGPATAAEFFELEGLTVNSYGTVTVSDVESHEMRYISGGYIDAEAGNYSLGSGYSGDGGPATAAEIGQIWDLYADNFFGNLYLPDQNYSVVRKVNNSGIISTIAGNGTSGFSGDGGLATAAEFHTPWSVAEDNFYNLYVSDFNNHRIREIKFPYDTVNTIAGGGISLADGIPATSAYISTPQHIAFDPAGNLYLFDEGSNRIRMISLSPIVSEPVPEAVCNNSNTFFAISVNGSHTFQWQVNMGSGFIYLSNTSPYSGVTTNTLLITGATYGMNGYIYRCLVDGGRYISYAVVLTVYSPINIVPSTGNVLCYNGNDGNASTSVSGGTSPYSYAWSNSLTTGNISGLTAGTYSLSVTDNKGCTATATATITQPNALKIVSDSMPDNGICNGAAWVMVSGGTAAYTYFWTGGNTTDSIFNQCHGYYCCLVTDAHGCMDSVCINVELATGTKQLPVNSGQVSVYPNPGNGAFTFEMKNEELIPIAIGMKNIEVFNVLGEKVYSQFLIPNASFVINLNQPSGIYFYRVFNNDGSVMGEGKIVVEK